MARPDDYEAAFRRIECLLASECGVSAGMASLLDLCAERVPDEVWSAVGEINFETDAANLQRWLERVLALEPPPDRIEAFWFGLFDAEIEDGRETCALYLSGAARFDSGGDSADWACQTPDSYLPEERYADSAVLDLIHRAVHGTEEAGFAQWALCLGYACQAVQRMCHVINPGLLVGRRASRSVAVGWDDGDWIVLGAVDRGGWRAAIVREEVR